jgi:hypothetical protein
MNSELKGYLKTEMTIAAAFNFFINGMAAALIRHKADYVPTDIISIAIDLTATCLFTFIISALFCRASVRRTKTAGILEAKSRFVRFSGKLFRRPVLFGLLMGLAAAAMLYILTAPLLLLLGIYALPFGAYISLKCVFAALLGGGVTLFELYSGMCKAG